MSQNDKEAQIIGYAQPWIVSPGEPVNIKVCCNFTELVPVLTIEDFIH